MARCSCSRTPWGRRWRCGSRRWMDSRGRFVCFGTITAGTAPHRSRQGRTRSRTSAGISFGCSTGLASTASHSAASRLAGWSASGWQPTRRSASTGWCCAAARPGCSAPRTLRPERGGYAAREWRRSRMPSSDAGSPPRSLSGGRTRWRRFVPSSSRPLPRATRRRARRWPRWINARTFLASSRPPS